MTSPPTRLEDQLAPHEPPYKSRGETQLGRVLDRYGIPFEYEKPTPVYDRGKQRIWHPDFTLPGYDNMLVEYAGMPSRSDYMRGVAHKKDAYRGNGYNAVFVYPRELKGRAWPDRLVRRLDSAYRPTTSYSYR